MFKIGVIADCLRLPLADAARAAADMGADGVQFYAVAGEASPEALAPGARAALGRMFRSLGLAVPAICGDLGGHGFERAAEHPLRLARTRAIVQLAADLGVPVVTTHIGVVPADRAGAAYGILAEACRAAAGHAAAQGVVLAVETGPETPERLALFLGDVGSRGLGVNYDPANLVMVQGIDPVPGVGLLAAHIVHTHAKDGICLAPCDPVAVYDAFAEGGAAAFPFGRYFNETPLGQGAVPWDAYLSALRAAGYQGFLTVERETGDDPVADIAAAVRFLKTRTGRHPRAAEGL